jgi:4-alpha-glucanotransferase
VTELDAGIAALGKMHGVQTAYTDASGTDRAPEQDVVVALLRALGVPLDRPEDAAPLLRDERVAAARRQLQPVLVHRIGREEDWVTATLPERAEPEEMWLGLELEDGTTTRHRLSKAVTGSLPALEVEGARYVRLALDLGAVAGGPIPPGRHRVTLEGPGTPAAALLVAAPACPPAPREWGAFVPLHAVRTASDWGIGSFTDLRRLGQWVASRGGALLGTLPLYPAFLEDPADPSPYLPVSRLAYNEVFVDPVRLPEFAATEAARDVVASPDFRHWAAAVHDATLVAYEDVARLKRFVLEPMAQTVSRLPDRRRGLEEFGRRNPELTAYARFRAGLERTGTGGEPDPDLVRYHLYCQWVAREQLDEAGHAVGRYADLPIGSHPQGFDPVWSPVSFVPGVQGGSPPDRFFPGGQDWGFHPLHPERIREDGYRFFSAVLARAFRHADCLRIDHVMGLQRLFMIPEGCEGEGAYVSYRAEEMHALVCLEAHLAGAVVVGEDLGTVPDGVRERMARDGMLRTWVFQFESTADTPLPEPPADSLATLGTHDLPRFGAYLWGDDIAEQERDGVLTAEESAQELLRRTEWRRHLLRALGVPNQGSSEAEVTAVALEGCLTHLARSDALVVLADLEELWDERRRQNHPGTGPAGANWRLRADRTLEELSRDPAVDAILAGLERRAS